MILHLAADTNLSNASNSFFSTGIGLYIQQFLYVIAALAIFFRIFKMAQMAIAGKPFTFREAWLPLIYTILFIVLCVTPSLLDTILSSGQTVVNHAVNGGAQSLNNIGK